MGEKAGSGGAVTDSLSGGKDSIALVNAALPNSKRVELSFAGIDGDRAGTKSSKAKVIVIGFWATYCAPCKAGFAKGMKIVFPAAGAQLDALKRYAVLTIVIINKDRKIVYNHAGRVPYSWGTLDAMIGLIDRPKAD